MGVATSGAVVELVVPSTVGVSVGVGSIIVDGRPAVDPIWLAPSPVASVAVTFKAGTSGEVTGVGSDAGVTTIVLAMITVVTADSASLTSSLTDSLLVVSGTVNNGVPCDAGCCDVMVVFEYWRFIWRGK